VPGVSVKIAMSHRMHARCAGSDDLCSRNGHRCIDERRKCGACKLCIVARQKTALERDSYQARSRFGPLA